MREKHMRSPLQDIMTRIRSYDAEGMRNYIL